MGIVKVLATGLVVVGGLIIGTVIDFVLKNKKKEVSADPELAKGTDLLCGTVTQIVANNDTGRSKIYVRDTKGKVWYGYSSIPSSQLEHLYMGKGYVQVPILMQAGFEQ